MQSPLVRVPGNMAGRPTLWCLQRIRVAGLVFALALGIPVVVAAQPSSTPVYFAPANILKFADHLFAEGEFAAAVAEYKRFLYTEVGVSPERARAFFQVGLSLRMLDSPDAAVEAFKAAAAEGMTRAFVRECRVQIAYTYLASGRWHDADVALKEALPDSTTPTDTTLDNLRGARLLLTTQWRAASEHFARQRTLGQPDASSIELDRIAADGLDLRPRSPMLGGVLSAIVPGAGRIYAGRTADGLLSMVAVTLTGWQAYRGFRRDGSESIRGWIFGSIGAFMYVGNVYGSVVSVKLRNETRAEVLVKRTGVALGVIVR